jgi:glutamine amidotransferase
MCELMGFNFARPTLADFTIREFARRSEENADGWGLAWYPDRSLALIKEAVKWRSSEHTGFLESYAGIRSTVCIAHVRHMTVGRRTHADTHPFARELGGKEYCLAHNGTLPDIRSRPPRLYRPVGQTDSEHFFCLLLEKLANLDGGLANPEHWPMVHAWASEFNTEGKLNFLLADGDRLLAYHDVQGWKGLAFKRMVTLEAERRRFEDAEMRLELGSEPANFGLVIATCPLSVTGWETFHRGELMVLEGGLMRYSSHRAVPQGASLAS